MAVALPLGLICGGILMLALAVGGILLLVFGLRGQQKPLDSAHSAVTTGKVTLSAVKDRIGTTEAGQTRTMYYPQVAYTYTVDGEEYRGERISSGASETFRREEEASAVILRYPPGSEVQVFYNPKNPQDAVIERGTTSNRVAVIAGVILLVVGVLVACVMLVGLLRGINF